MKKAVFAAVALVFAGCAAVERARDAQKAAAPTGAGEVSSPRRVFLRGATLQELVAFAVTNRPSMASAALAVEDARLAMKEIAADSPLASSTPWNAAGLSASLGYSETSKQSHSIEAKTGRGKLAGGLSLDLLVWDFGRNAARARAQAENVVAAELALVEEGFSVFGEVADAYFALLRDDALVEVAATNLQQYADHLARAEDMLGAGEARELDVLKARLDLARARESLVAASNDVAVAGANLMSALGIDASQGGFEAVLGERPGEMRACLAPSSADSEGEFAFARTNSPAMQIARARLRAASAQVDYAVADMKPSVSASLSLNWTDPLWYWRWGLSAAQSLFTGWRKETAVDRAVVAMQRAEREVEDSEKAVSRKIEVALAERDNAREALRTAEESLAEARENLDAVTAQFEVGEISRIEFSDAVSACAEARAGVVKAFYRGQSAEAALVVIDGRDPEYLR